MIPCYLVNKMLATLDFTSSAFGAVLLTYVFMLETLFPLYYHNSLSFHSTSIMCRDTFGCIVLKSMALGPTLSPITI